MIKSWSKYILGLILLIAIYVVGVLVHGTVTEYAPTGIEVLELKNESIPQSVISDSTLIVTSWNIGYAGLSAEANIFYPSQGIFRSKGKMVRLEEALVKRNISESIRFLKENPSDFFLIQEMDISAKRSYHIPMLKEYQQALPEYASTFAVNFDVNRVPPPILEPWNNYGDVISGVATFLKYKPRITERHQLPGSFSWPNRIFLLDRCLSIHKIPTAWGNEVVIINLHNSAYDKTGEIKAKELAYLKKVCEAEYEKGNYVIVGGDWNQSPPYFPANTFNKTRAQRHRQNIPVDLFAEDWKWIYDPTLPTVRSTSEIYNKDSTPQGLIDFFLLSPNCAALSIKCINQDFKWSDHQPVRLELRLK